MSLPQKQSNVENTSTPKKYQNKAKIYFLRLHAKYKDRKWWRYESLLLLVAIIFGIASATMKNYHTSKRLAALKNQFSMTEVYVVNQDISAGTIVNDGHLTASHNLSSNTTKNFINKQNLKMILNRQLTVDLKKGDPMLITAVINEGEIRKIAETIPSGQRLFTLSVKDSTLANGMIKPNDRVDIIAHMNFPEKGPTSFTILQNITLAAVGNTSVINSENKIAAANISFYITKEKSELLAYAQKHGSFSLSLRNPGDESFSKEKKSINSDSFLDDTTISHASGGSDLKVIKK